MILTTHLVAGTVLAELVFPARPFLGFGLGFLSHFLLDAIPHWDYRLSSRINNDNPLDSNFSINNNFLGDLLKVGLDLLAGILAIWLALKLFNLPWSWSGRLAALASVLPDFLQFAYAKLRWRPLRYLQIWHHHFHAKTSLEHFPLRGIIDQLLLIVVAFWFMLVLKS